MTGPTSPGPLLFDLLPASGRRGDVSVSNPPPSWRFDGLRPMGYRRLLADPPWYFKNRSEEGEGRNAVQHYDCMELGDILALPVQQLAHRDGCLLWMWATWPMLREGMACLDA